MSKHSKERRRSKKSRNSKESRKRTKEECDSTFKKSYSKFHDYLHDKPEDYMPKPAQLGANISFGDDSVKSRQKFQRVAGNTVSDLQRKTVEIPVNAVKQSRTAQMSVTSKNQNSPQMYKDEPYKDAS